MDNRAVGIFDSGLGGLTALKAFQKILPNENVIYFADNARCPYGTKSIEQLRQIACENLDYLASFDVKAILTACGTMSVNVRDILDSYKIPVFNVLIPSIDAMCAVRDDGVLAVLATDASIKTGVYQEMIAEKTGREVIGIACQDFVKLSEQGHTEENDPDLLEAVERYLSPLKKMKVAGMLLGCTHFGLMEQAIRNYVPGCEIVSASEAAAAAFANYLIENQITGGQGDVKYLSSGEDICLKTL